MAIKSFYQKTELGLSKRYELGADAKNVDVTVQLEDGTTEIHNLQQMIDNKEIGGGSAEGFEWIDIY